MQKCFLEKFEKYTVICAYIWVSQDSGNVVDDEVIGVVVDGAREAFIGEDEAASRIAGEPSFDDSSVTGSS